MVTWADLPEMILVDIFSWLPTKSIGKFRCLSKTWLDLLSCPQFIKSHLARAKTRHENLILIFSYQQILSVETIKEKDTVSTELDLPGFWSQIVSSCDGLVLLLEGDNEIILANPITLEQVKIPSLTVDWSNISSVIKENTMYGFGYDSVGDDYKVVAVSTLCFGLMDTFVDVYSLKWGVWKRVKSMPYSCTSLVIPAGVYVNGAIHFLGARRDELDYLVIAAFDLSDEAFFEIPAPSVQSLLGHILVVLGGCLCLMDSNFEVTDLWVMKEYGVADSWMRIRVHGYGCGSGVRIKPLCFVGEEEIVLVEGFGRLVVYNVKEGVSRYLVVDGDVDNFGDGGTFVETLVSPAPPSLRGACEKLNINPYADR